MELTHNQTQTESQAHIFAQPPGFFRRLSIIDWLYAALLAAGALFALNRFSAHMDYYEQAVLVLSVPTFAWLGWHWKPVRALILAMAVLSLWAISLYGGVLDMANKKFLLKYLLSSQSAILWMSTLFFLSTLFYWGGLLTRSDFGGSVGSKLCWAAVLLGFTGMLVRWYESYLVGADVGHIPVSNLYEVFILFCMITALFYLYYEQHYAAATGAGCLAGDFSRRRLSVVVHGDPQRLRNSAARSRSAKLVDENSCSCELHRLWHFCPFFNGRSSLIAL